MTIRKKIERLELERKTYVQDLDCIVAKLNELIDMVNEGQQYSPGLVELLSSIVTGVKVENPNAATIMCDAFDKFEGEINDKER